MSVERGRGRVTASLESAMVARRFYLANKQKNEIAEELGISRFKVARLLDEARESGIVRIQIDVPTELDLELGEQVAQRFHVRRVLAARTLDKDPESLSAVVGAAAAQYLSNILGATDLLGISWGRALTSTVDAFSTRSATSVVQLAGGINARHSDIGGEELVRRMAAKTGGKPYPLHAPFLVGSAEMARELRGDPSLADAVSVFGSLTVAAVGVGAWDPPSSAVFNELTASERSDLASLRTTADICGIVFDDKGQVVTSPLTERVVGITLDELRRVPEIIAIAGGRDKVAAIAAGLRSGLVSTLVTDTHTARRLLRV